MGTRNLTMVIHKHKPVVAQYGQWDGYPKGQGYTVLEFLKKRNLEIFKKKLENVRFVNDEDQEAEYPYMSREHGADILDMIYKSKGEIVLGDSRQICWRFTFL